MSQTAVRERPILFHSDLGLEDRKTQTRRLVKIPKWGQWPIEQDGDKLICTCKSTGCLADIKPRYRAGDVLYVAESVFQIGHERTGKNGQYLWPKFNDEAVARRWFDSCCRYTADLMSNELIWYEPHGLLNKLFMPPWAARTRLRIEEVRVQRVQEISEEDAIAEGLAVQMGDGPGPGAGFKWTGPGYWDGLSRGDFGPTYHVKREGLCCCKEGQRLNLTPARCAYRILWNKLYGKGAWELNSWIWAITFSRIGG
jgi:hypothetical protein